MEEAKYHNKRIEQEKKGLEEEMGKRKLMIRRLESLKARQAKYSKRKLGILKKAKELAILCDVDLALVMFSPTGRPSFYSSQDKDLSTVLGRLASISIEDKDERRAYTMRLLKKMYSENEIDPRNFSINRNELLKLKEDQLQQLKEKLAERTRILREWKHPEKIDEVAQINLMEDHLIATLGTVRSRKVQLREQQRRNETFQGAVGFPASFNLYTEAALPVNGYQYLPNT